MRRAVGLRLWILVNLVIFLAVALPGLLDHPYPVRIRHDVEWGGLALYFVSSFWQLFVATRG